MDNESIHSESEFYLYPEEQDKENDKRSGNLNILVDKENDNDLDEIQEFIEQQRPKNTTKKTTYDLMCGNGIVILCMKAEIRRNTCKQTEHHELEISLNFEGTDPGR